MYSLELAVDVKDKKMLCLGMFRMTKMPEEVQVSVDNFLKDMKLFLDVYNDFVQNSSCFCYNEYFRTEDAKQYVLQDWAYRAGIIRRCLDYAEGVGQFDLRNPSDEALFRDNTFSENPQRRKWQMFDLKMILLKRIKNSGYDENKLLEFRNKYFKNSFVHLHKMYIINSVILGCIAHQHMMRDIASGKL